ncbi:MAG: M20 family metallopeptidase [Planctomycetaceae bacterium]
MMDPVSLLKDLIRIPSVNPMGRDLSGPEFFETRLTEFLSDLFARHEIESEVIEVSPGRANVVARLDHGSGTTVLLDAHQDTVPVEGMTIAPFDPAERDGRIYGRGACDVKGGLAAMLAALLRLHSERPAGAANVVLSCTCDEESTVTGIRDLVELWSGRDRRSALLREPPDVAVVAEPTELHIVVAHRGATRWKIRTRGVACHSSRPQDGINAIYRMATVLRHVEEYARRLPETVPLHPLCGPATLSVGRIDGGASVNTVPDCCEIEIDRRCIPGEDGWAVIEDLRAYLAARLDFDIEFLPPWTIAETLSDEHNAQWADRLMEHVAHVAGSREKIGVPYGTHASRIAATGVPAMVFGPGSIAQAHTKDEWIEIEQLHRASEICYRFCANP